ncbi:MAG TPA: glycosyltransferase [Chitinophagales bacterium]|nr:glycosyltransferase [Chitinophagales bacterium]
MQRISSTLAGNGYKVTLVGFNKKNSQPLSNQNFEQERITVVFKKGKLFFIEYNIRLFFWLLFRKFDMYGAIDLDTVMPVFINAKLKGKICVYDAHEFYEELPELVGRPVIQKFWKTVAKIFLSRIKNNYTVSQSIANALSKKYKQSYSVIRNVPVLKKASSKQFVKQNQILYQGALNKGRGLEELIDAMEMINADLIIAGEGDLSNEIRAFAAEKKYSHRIHFTGLLSPDALKEKTLQAKVGVNLVAHLGLSYYYSLSNKFFDYIQAGIPQVTMDFPEYSLINTQYNIAILIDSLSVEKIAEAVNALLNNTTLYNTLSGNTESAKQELNWSNEQKKLLEFYKHVR